MNRSWIAFAMMLIALGGTLGALGSTFRAPMARDSAHSLGHFSTHVTFCEMPLSRGVYRYEEGCGFDRLSGLRYSLPQPEQPQRQQGWSMLIQMHIDQTLASIAALSGRSETTSDEPADTPWPAVAVTIEHPAAPSFYDDHAARDYALAQGQAWRDSGDPLQYLPPGAAPPQSVVLIELRPSTLDLDWLCERASGQLNRVVRTIRRYPAAHNTRITLLALENRANRLMANWLPAGETNLADSRTSEFQGAASSVGLDPSEYEELVQRAMERLPAPEKMESPPQFRPAPSRQKMLRMASATLQALSDLLDDTASKIERVAAGEIATREDQAPKR